VIVGDARGIWWQREGVWGGRTGMWRLVELRVELAWSCGGYARNLE
jgi:hypothetical protein